jgi:hypothetical protein
MHEEDTASPLETHGRNASFVRGGVVGVNVWQEVPGLVGGAEGWGVWLCPHHVPPIGDFGLVARISNRLAAQPQHEQRADTVTIHDTPNGVPATILSCCAHFSGRMIFDVNTKQHSARCIPRIMRTSG